MLDSHPNKIDLIGITHRFEENITAISSVNLSAHKGEMICIMGPSGCGKSTLIRILAGQLNPTKGKVLFNGHSVYDNLKSIRPYISYIPEEDSFDPLLTVKENITCSAAIRCPQFSITERRKQVKSRLIELGLSQRRNRLAGDEQNKSLSGGERKRLNTGLDMVSIAGTYLFDEPTSGLSSKDSENIMEIIRSLSKNKITFVSIHQPNSQLFNLFDKALLLDKGGMIAFFGTPSEMLHYFQDAQTKEIQLASQTESTSNTKNQTSNSADLIFDVLETPLRDDKGNIIYVKESGGHFTPGRKFSPNFWRNRFDNFRRLQTTTKEGRPDQHKEIWPIPVPPNRHFKENVLHLKTHIRRSFLSKLRNRGSLLTTLLAAPALALLVATVLRYSGTKQYTFGTATHIPAYLFISLVIAMFLGLTNSADEIIRDKRLIMRERGHGIRVWQYISGKFLVGAAFAFLQCLIYLSIGNSILGIQDMFWVYFSWIFLTSLIGTSIGLLISSLVNNAKTALNIIPLVLIPQIILGGALIKYEEMNLHFALFSGKSIAKNRSNLEVPFICNLIPLRWSYESLVIAQDTLNPLAKMVTEIDRRKKLLLNKTELTETEKEQFNNYKDAHTIVFGIQENGSKSIREKIEKIGDDLRFNTFAPSDYYTKPNPKLASSIDIYQNHQIRNLITKAEIEIEDYRLYEFDSNRSRPNVFYGKLKTYYGKNISTLKVNALAMFAFIVFTICALMISLRRQFVRV